MKPLGAFLLVLGLCVGAGLALWPTTVTVFGTDIGCSSPIRRVISQDDVSPGDTVQQQVVDQCRSQSWTHIVIGVVGGVVLVGAGMIMLVAARNEEKIVYARPIPAIPPGWYPDPSNPNYYVRFWDGVQWSEHTTPR